MPKTKTYTFPVVIELIQLQMECCSLYKYHDTKYTFYILFLPGVPIIMDELLQYGTKAQNSTATHIERLVCEDIKT